MILFPSGDKKKGIEQLRTASEKASYANVEASYFLMQLLFNYEKQYAEALSLASKLHQRFQNNSIFHRHLGRCQYSMGRWEEMHRTFGEILERVKAKKTGYSDAAEREAVFYWGLYSMNDEHFEEALKSFYRCDELSRKLDSSGPSGFMVMGNLRIGMIYDKQAKRDLAALQYKKVLKMNDYLDCHKQAEQYLKTPFGKQ